MKKLYFIILTFFLCYTTIGQTTQNAWIRINQVGYLPQSQKVGVWVSKSEEKVTSFSLVDVLTKKVVFHSSQIQQFGKYASFQSAARLNFSKFTQQGTYYLQVGQTKSPIFRINADVYEGSADFVLKYMRQQRSGYNPFLKDSCHKADGFIVYHPDKQKDSTHLDVSGGWHDASDYLQYVTTSANAIFQMMFAYQENPEVYTDKHDAWGNLGKNGIPDILDEAKWGLDWLVKMNPAKHEFYNQLADDRDHRGLRLPNKDLTKYATNQGLARPVYFITGKPQGFKYKNRTTGVSSTVGKFASAFALGHHLFQSYYPAFAKQLKEKAIDAYQFGKEFPGVSQTAPGGAPYFYEEDNWVDDMELAATQLSNVLTERKIVDEAATFGRQEPTTPWMGADTARHYQWYPFVNLGHYFLAKNTTQKTYSKEFKQYLESGIEKVFQRGKNNPFLNGVPFVWCSNNYVSGLITQLVLYRKLTNSTKYIAMEAAMRDWLLGCNPWGTSMICGYPNAGISPQDPHSAFTHLYNYKIDGGLVDGPVYGSIWNKLIGITLYQPDEYAQFQSDLVVYHDDYGDYSTDEPTMDGTASLSFLLSHYEKEGLGQTNSKIEKESGGIIRMNPNEKKIYLAFTGHEFNDGGETITKVLDKQHIKANFFFTGDFYRNPAFKTTIEKLIAQKNYVGCHSDKHLLYAPWTNRDSLLINKEQFTTDLQQNYDALAKFGVQAKQAQYFMPPYEWYNQTIVDWTKQAGLTLVNYTGGTSSNADYTTPDMPNYKSSEQIFQRIFEYEASEAKGLNGFILLTHIGVSPERKDKFYDRLDELIQVLKAKGYSFAKFE
ncbi:glycoside hydrolase family 9 protein [Arcicella aquatica]|uniref:Glycoside hydrolase family 9 protein n=1 Tax=Arcicella aquatica TaxID=217141 RepID=A0ABU5QUB2_9BACT|nr:glycoside hydrolase family 9 protein [Arcicella aquatica]MEA5260290.1 glycoside hydrolase family 9 protein [Arcicella aquatica]